MRIRTVVAGFVIAAAIILGGSQAHAGEQPADEPKAEVHELSPDTEECIHLAEEADDPEACQQSPSPILPATNEIIWGALSFLVLMFLMHKFAWPSIKQGMEGRTERIRADLDTAEEAKAEAQSVLADYRAQLADAKAESGRIIEEARKQADQVRQDQEAKLQADLGEMREKAQADIEAAKVQLMSEMQGDVAALAIGAAEVVVEKNLDQATQVQLIENYINQVNQRSQR